MKLGLDMERWRALSPARRQMVADWVNDHGHTRCVEYNLVGEGVIDLLCYLMEPGTNNIIPLWWIDAHGHRCASAVMIWRRGVVMEEAPPAIEVLDT